MSSWVAEVLQPLVSSGDEPEEPEKVEAEAVATAVSNHLESLDGAFLEALTSFADAVRREDASIAREPVLSSRMTCELLQLDELRIAAEDVLLAPCLLSIFMQVALSRALVVDAPCPVLVTSLLMLATVVILLEHCCTKALLAVWLETVHCAVHARGVRHYASLDLLSCGPHC